MPICSCSLFGATRGWGEKESGQRANFFCYGSDLQCVRMAKASLWNKTRARILVPDLDIADSFLSRLCGLLGKRELPEDSGLLLDHCHQVHMFFMRFAIDLIFLSEAKQVVHLERQLRPWRVSSYIPEAKTIIEIPAGSLEHLSIQLGDVLEVRSSEDSQ